MPKISNQINDMPISYLLTEVFNKLENEKIEYCILRNYETLPDQIENDIDICVSPLQINEFISILDTVAKEHGLNKHLNIEYENHAVYYYKEIDSHIYQLHIDLYESFKYKGKCYLSADEVLKYKAKYKNFWVANKEIESFLKFLHPYLNNGMVKEKYKTDIEEIVSTECKYFKVLLSNTFNESYMLSLLKKIKNKEWQKINGEYQEARKIFFQNNGSSVFCYKNVKEAVLHKQRILKRIIKPKGLAISLMGTDGVGKSTVIKGITVNLTTTFPEGKIKVFHWRPGLLPAPNKLKKEVSQAQDHSNPHKLEPYSFFISLVRLLYFSLDYIVGYWVIVRPAKASGCLVIFDRYYEDFFVDTNRYRLKVPRFILSFINVIIPKVDISFCLNASLSTILSRKCELEVPEIERQLEAYLSLAQKKENCFIADANHTAEKVSQYLTSKILLHMSNRERD